MLITTNCSLDEEGLESYPSSFLDSFKASDINFMMSVSIYLKFLPISKYRHKPSWRWLQACYVPPPLSSRGSWTIRKPGIGLYLSKGCLGALEPAGVSSPFGFAIGNGE